MTSKISLKKKPKKTARINNGNATNNLIFSAYQGSNNAIFPCVLELYVAENCRIADVTYGKGIFWKNIDISKYEFFPSDLRTDGLPEDCRGGIDCRELPYQDEFFDVIVFDPPYMHTPGGTAHNGHQNYEEYYANNVEQNQHVIKTIWEETNGNPPKYHEAVLDLYYRTGKEAWRVLKENGIFIVKCQDEVCANRQRLTHIEITIELEKYGFITEDLFVVMRTNKPGISRLKNRQQHARKNHSYFMVYRKPKGKSNLIASQDLPLFKKF